MTDIDLVKRAKHIIENGGMLARDTSLALIEQLEAAQRERDEAINSHRHHAARLIDDRGQLRQRAEAAEAELKRRDDAVPDDRIIDDGCEQYIGGVQQSDRLNCVWPVGTKFYAAAPAAEPEKAVELPEWFYPDGDIDCPPAVNLCDVKNALDAAGVKWVEGE